MLVLREVLQNGVQSNNEIGRYTSVIKEKAPDEFDKFFDNLKAKELSGECTMPMGYKDDFFGIIVYNNGQSYELLRNNRIYYVMSDSGQTFECLYNRNVFPVAN